MGGCFAWDEGRPRASHATHTEPPPHSKAMAYTKMYATATVRNTAGAGDARCGWGELLKKYAGACPSDRSCHCSVARSRPCWPRPHFHSASQHPPTAVRKPTKRQATAPGRTQEAGQHTRQHPSPTHKIRSWAGTLGNTLPRAEQLRRCCGPVAHRWSHGCKTMPRAQNSQVAPTGAKDACLQPRQRVWCDKNECKSETRGSFGLQLP